MENLHNDSQFFRFLEALRITIEDQNPKKFLNCIILPEFLKLICFEKLKELQIILDLYWHKPYVSNTAHIRKIQDELVYRYLMARDLGALLSFMTKHFSIDPLTLALDNMILKSTKMDKDDWIGKELVFLEELQNLTSKESRFGTVIKEILQSVSLESINRAFTYAFFVRHQSAAILDEYLQSVIVRKIVTVGTPAGHGDNTFFVNPGAIRDELNETARAIQFELIGSHLTKRPYQFSFMDTLMFWDDFHGGGRSASLAFAYLSYAYENPEFRILAPYTAFFGSYKGELVTEVEQIDRKVKAAIEHGVRIIAVSEPDKKKLSDYEGCEVICYPTGSVRDVLHHVINNISSHISSIREIYKATSSDQLTLITDKKSVIEDSLQTIKQDIDDTTNTANSPKIIGENRLLTILSIDISESISSHQPTEISIKEFRENYNLAKEIIERYDGNISQFSGNNILVAFGVPIIHENDTERAILAAIDIQKTFSQIGLEVSIGISTGITYFGSIDLQTDQDISAYGPEVNTAKRLQEFALSGQILTSNKTYNLAKTSFNFKELSDLYQSGESGIRLKGINIPVPIYEVLNPRIHPEKLRGIDELNVQMVGRESEFTNLKGICEQWLEGKGQVVSVIGEAGIGKSKLIREFVEDLRQKNKDQKDGTKSIIYLEGRCLSIGQPVGYGPFLDAFRAYFELREEDSNDIAINKVSESIDRLFQQNPDEITSLFANLLSLRYGSDDYNNLQTLLPEQLRQKTMMTLCDLFRCLAKTNPVILILEDLHWADDLSMDLISLLIGLVTEIPLLIVCVYRPEKEHRAWHIRNLAQRKSPERYSEIILHPLSNEESYQLLDSLLKDIPDNIKDNILEKSEGNPLFIEEAIRSLIDRGFVYQENDRWKIRDIDENIVIPDTIYGVVLSRVDQLNPQSRYVIQYASVIGRIFKKHLLQHLTQMDLKLEQSIKSLEDRDLVYIERTFPEVEYTFNHVLTQVAIYQSIPSQIRMDIHYRVASSIENLYQNRLEEYYDELAYHWEKSNNIEKTLEYLIKAGQKAFKYYDNKAGITYFSKAIEVAIQNNLLTSEEIGNLYMECGNVQIKMSEYDNAMRNYERALEYIQNNILRAKIYAGIAYAYRWLMDDINSSDYYNNLAIAEIKFIDDSSDKASIYLECSINMVSHPDKYLDESKRIAEILDNRALLAYIYSWEAFIYGFWMQKERSYQAFNIAKQYLPYLEKSDDIFALAESYMMLGEAAIMGEVADRDLEKKQLHTRAIEYAEKAGHTTNLAFTTWFLGGVYCGLGNSDKAILIYRKGWKICLENHLLRPSPLGVSTYLLGNSLVDVYSAQNDVSSIMQLFDELVEATASLLARYRQTTDKNSFNAIWERWNNSVIERMTQKIFLLSSEYTDMIQTRWNEHISNIYNDDIHFVYHICQMRIELKREAVDSAKYHSKWLLDKCREGESLETLIPSQDSLLVYLLLRHKKIAEKYMDRLLGKDFSLFISILSYDIISDEINQIMDWEHLNEVILASLQKQTFTWMFLQIWFGIQKFLIKCKREDVLCRLADQIRQAIPEKFSEIGISHLQLVPIDLSRFNNLEFRGAFAQESLASWEWVDPANDCKYEFLPDDSIKITVPPQHDISEINLNGPRLVREMNRDFIIETCVTNGSTGIKNGGLFIWKDEYNYIRFETPSPSALGWEDTIYYGANVSGKFIHPGVHHYKADTVWLRLERTGDRFTGYVSKDGDNWYLCGWADILMQDPIKVGIHALCATWPTTSTIFKYFRIYDI